MRYASVSMTQIGRSSSPAVSGARSWQTFRRVLLPLVPGLIAGWVYIFVVSIRELAARFSYLPPPATRCSPCDLGAVRERTTPELAALGVLMVAGLVVLVANRTPAGREGGADGP